MKKLLPTITLFIISQALTDTTIKISQPASAAQLTKASDVLKEAAALELSDKKRAPKVKRANKLTLDKLVNKKFDAELKCDGAKQFEGAENYDIPSACCFKGDINIAKDLIDSVLAHTDDWDWEEQKVKSVKIDGDEIKIVIRDMPNAFDSNVIARKCDP